MTSRGDPFRAAIADRLFTNGGEAGELLAAIDWAATPLGPVENWPASLRTSIRICLTSRHPILLWWGNDFVKIYNDAYAPMLGQKHPWALGQPGRHVWPEIWDIIGPMLESVHTTGQATWSDDQLLVLQRRGYPEECYFTFSYSPVEDDAGKVCGIFSALTETTERVLAGRRAQVAQELAAGLAEAHSTESVAEQALAVLANAPMDVPCSLVYRVEDDGQTLTWLGGVGVAAGSPLSPPTCTLSASSLWPIAADGTPRVLKDLVWPSESYQGDAALTPHTALVYPVIEPGKALPTLVWVAGISPRLPLDAAYHSWFTTLGGHLATALAAAHAYQAERQRAEDLAALDRAKTVFFSNVSHEFRTPLTLMLGPLADAFADATHPLSPEQRTRLEIIGHSSQRLLRLVNTLLDFSRIEAGRMRATFTPTDLAQLTTDLASTFRSLVERAGMKLIIDCPPLSQPVYVDRDQWEQIVLNLLSNAFKFTFTGHVAVRLSTTEGHAQLAIEDTGIGIPAAELPHIFERFHRVEGAQGRSYEGSGIGLALVHDLLHLHGGHITVVSAEGVGTTFTITLPLGTAHLPAERVQADAVTAAAVQGAETYVIEAERWLATTTVPPLRVNSGTPLTRTATPAELGASVLVADDNADMRDYLVRLLGERYRVRAVSNGSQALAAVQQDLPDLVLSDVMMPVLDGYGLLRALRAERRTAAIPVILLSARAGEEATIEGLEAGADDYLVKPFTAREVLVRVAARLEIARARRESEMRVQQLEAVIEAVTDSLGVYDTTGRSTLTNAAFRAQVSRHTGLTADGTYSERARRLTVSDAYGEPIPVDQLPQARALRGATLQGTEAMEVTIAADDGEETHFSVSGGPIRDSAGAIVGAVIVHRDVTEQRQFERRTQNALKAVTELARFLVREAGGARAVLLGRLVELACPVLGCDIFAVAGIEPTGGRFVPLATTGRTPEEEASWYATLGEHGLGDYYTPDQVRALERGEVVTLDVAAAQHLPAYATVNTLVAPLAVDGRLDGVMAWAYQQAHEFTAAERDMAVNFAQIVQLVLDYQQLLAEREEAQVRQLALEEANRRMNEFLGIASHELRTPLTSITANVQLSERGLTRLLNEAGPVSAQSLERYQRLAERTTRQALRLDRLVGDLLDVSRITAGKLDLHFEGADLAAVVRDAVEAVQASWPARVVTLSLPQRRSLNVVMDADRIGQVMLNLLNNALKYSPPDTEVGVAISLGRQEVRVSVQDHGLGIPAEHQARLFERFYRVPGIEQLGGSGVGLGLGLYISHSIVSRHDGEIGVTSAAGKGTTFWFRLPRRRSLG